MIDVRFKGPLARSIGFNGIEVKGGNLDEVLEEASKKLGIKIFRSGEKMYMVVRSGGKEVKFTVSVFYKGRNVITAGINEIKDGTLEIITPMGGG